MPPRQEQDGYELANESSWGLSAYSRHIRLVYPVVLHLFPSSFYPVVAPLQRRPGIFTPAL